MAKGVRMKVTQQIVGNHDDRILVGSHPESGFSWGGGEEIVVTAELAANYEQSGIARRLVSADGEDVPRETATEEPAETAVTPTPAKRKAK